MNMESPKRTELKVRASSMPAILGLDKRFTAYEIFCKTLGLVEDEPYTDDDVREWGNIMEDPIAQKYMSKTGEKLRRQNAAIIRPDAPWLSGHIDRDVVGKRKGVEIKNVHWTLGNDWGKTGTDDVPEYYLPQAMTYMYLKDYEEWDVAAMIGGSDLRIFTLYRSAEWDELILDASYDFHQCLIKDMAPEMDWAHKSARSLLKRMYTECDGEVMELDESILKWTEIQRESAAKEKMYKAIKTGAENHILATMGNSGVGKLSDGTEWARTKTQRSEFTVKAAEFVTFRNRKTKVEKQ